MKHRDYLYFVRYYFISCCVFEIRSLCPQPDVPTNGKYSPKQSKFEPGDKIIYSCNNGFALSGTDRRICKSNGGWSDFTPFCDPSAKLSNPSVPNKDVRPSLVSRVIDSNFKTCFDWHNATGEYLYVHLDKAMVINTVDIFLKKGITKIEIFTGLDNDMKKCADFHNFIETDRWISIQCKSHVLADTVKILAIEKRFISVCEIQIYGKEEDSCDRSPTRIVPNGHFEVSRSKATLICEEGYRSENNRLVCEGNTTWAGPSLKCDEILCDAILPTGRSSGEWTFPDGSKKLSSGARSQLVCMTGYGKTGNPDVIICQKNGTWSKTNATCVENKPKLNTRAIILGSAGIAVILLIISLLATTVHFVRKQRTKQVVVVFQNQSDGSVPLSASEMEYSISRYEQLPPKAPEPPSTPRPIAFAVNTNSSNAPSELLKKRAQLPDVTFDTMKASTIYGS